MSKTQRLFKLQFAMVRWAEHHMKKERISSGNAKLPSDWTGDLERVLRLKDKQVFSVLTTTDKKFCNKLYRKYLGYV